jgi:hypothetical protein
VRNRDLDNYDTIVFCSQDPKSIVDGLTEPYPEEYRGGIGTEGLTRLKTFAEHGGVLLLLGEACDLAGPMGLEVEDLAKGLDRAHFYIPGTILKAAVNNRHPIGYGMGQETAVMFDNSPFFDASRGLSIVCYSKQDTILSGWARGENLLANQSGLTELRTGQGAVILIGFRTQFRAQARATFKFLFNALYYATTFRS